MKSALVLIMMAVLCASTSGAAEHTALSTMSDTLGMVSCPLRSPLSRRQTWDKRVDEVPFD